MVIWSLLVGGSCISFIFASHLTGLTFYLVGGRGGCYRPPGKKLPYFLHFCMLTSNPQFLPFMPYFDAQQLDLAWEMPLGLQTAAAKVRSRRTSFLFVRCNLRSCHISMPSSWIWLGRCQHTRLDDKCIERVKEFLGTTKGPKWVRDSGNKSGMCPVALQQ